jgi:hypothetical protein
VTNQRQMSAGSLGERREHPSLSASTDIIEKSNFPKKLNAKIDRSNCKISKQPCWKSTSKNYSPSFHGIYKIVMFKDQRLFFWVHYS